MRHTRVLASFLVCSFLGFQSVCAAVPRTVKIAGRSVFRVIVPMEDDKTTFGTAFCAPGNGTTIISAGHALKPGAFLLDQYEQIHKLAAISTKQRPDIGVGFLESHDRACELHPFEWAKEAGEVGDAIWMVGYPGGFSHPVITTGIISTGLVTEPGVFVNVVISQLHGERGESGSPIFNAAGEVIGVLTAGTNSGSLLAFIPVQEIRKAIK